MVEFKEIKLDGVIIPYCTNEEGVDYYPIKYIVEQFLLKSYGQIHRKEHLKEFVRRYIIDFSFKGTTPQECYCMCKEGWIKYVSNIKKNKNKSKDKIYRLRIFCEFLGVEYKDETIKEYDAYTLRCIDNFKSKSPKVQDKQCVKCERVFPNSEYFYPPDYQGGIANTCRACNNINWKNDNKEEKYVYEIYGLDGFINYKKDRIDFIFNNSNNDFIIQSDNKKNEALNIIKEMYNKGYISSENLNVDYVKSNSGIKFKIGDKNISLKNNELIEYCSEGECRLRPWLYPEYKLGRVSIKEGVEIFKRYLNENNINIEDKFNNHNWDKLLRKAKLSQFNLNILEFVVELYNKEYGGYTFHIRSINYYKNRENCIFDMKYFIEKDLKIPIEKIPLYVTKYALHEKAGTLYRLITKDKKLRPYETLFDWINDCYPGKFIEADFDINPYRSKFDSLEEAQVDEQLRLRFNNVIYNPRDKEYKVEIMGMIPDWIIITENGCYLTEYYGMYSEGDISSSHRLQRYKTKTEDKLKKYKELESNGYKHLAIFPEDIRNNFEGLHRKIDLITNK